MIATFLLLIAATLSAMLGKRSLCMIFYSLSLLFLIIIFYSHITDHLAIQL